MNESKIAVVTNTDDMKHSVILVRAFAPFTLNGDIRIVRHEPSDFRINFFHYGIASVEPAMKVNLSTSVTAEWKMRSLSRVGFGRGFIANWAAVRRNHGFGLTEVVPG
jgi:hypothetical protein